VSDLRTLLEAPWLVFIGWSLVLSVWSTTMVALVLGAWRIHGGARAAAPVQYRAAVLSLAAAVASSLAVPALLMLTVAPSAVRAPTETGQTRVTSQEVVTPRGGPATTARTDSGATASNVRPSLAVPASVLGVLVLLWSAGVAVGLLRLLGGWIVAGRLGARAALIDEGPVRDTFDRVRQQTHAGPARLAVSLEVEAPVAIGVRSPTVVVPGLLLEHLPPDSLAPILAHELSHVARRDYAVNLAQSVAEVLLFHSPAIWWLGRRIREVREFCCDDSAVAVAGDRTRYVEALTLVARLGALTGVRPVLGMAGPRLITRVRRLLEGEPIVTMPYARTALIATLGVLLAAAVPRPFTAASAHLSARVFAAGAQDMRAIPLAFPQRQDGSALRIHRVESTATHVCGTFDVQNVSHVSVVQVRFVGILSFASGANRPVEITESHVVDATIAPGAVATLDAGLLEVTSARRAAAGGHVQAMCALREVVSENQAAWHLTPNPAATTGTDALGVPRPTVPRTFVGQTSAMATPITTLCLDEKGAEYSPGAQVAIRDEPGRAARCTREGQWIEVTPRDGEPPAADVHPSSSDDVIIELGVAGVAGALSVRGRFGTVATMQLPGGQKWGFVPGRGDGRTVEVALHDLTATPHRLVGTRSLSPGETVTFAGVEPALSLRLGGQ
jgi:beta-lactamase regulating signal transducer with metallopeptidase domain